MQSYLQHVIDRLYLRFKSPDAQRQVGAMPYAIIDEHVNVLLVTSKRSGRWIFPKGSQIEGQMPWETAAQEALEEAGVEGKIGKEPIGSYRTIKKGEDRRHVVEVDIYPLHVTAEFDDWQEKNARDRRWALMTEAKALLNDPTLAGLTAKLGHQLTATTQRAGKRKGQ